MEKTRTIPIVEGTSYIGTPGDIIDRAKNISKTNLSAPTPPVLPELIVALDRAIDPDGSGRSGLHALGVSQTVKQGGIPAEKRPIQNRT